ncbi:MAG: SDR family oxidoreductase [Pseudomonadota bacterium]
MTDRSGTRTLVTGATSGIGAGIVRVLRAESLHVMAIGRRAERLEALAQETGCRTMAADVRESTRLRDAIEEFAPDVVINNAGVGHGIMGLEQIGLDDIQEAIEINVIAPMQITSLALAGMRQRRRGHIVNIGSIAGLHTLTSAVYGGSKAAVHVFSQNLRHELRGTGIRVTEICPGRVSSEFYDSALGDEERLAAAKQTGITELSPEDIGRTILFAIQAPAHMNIATVEILPTEQAIGGVALTPTEP